MIRELAAYNANDELAYSLNFPEERIPALSRLFDTSNDEQMIVVYHVTPEMRDQVSRILGHDLDASLDYFIESFSS